MSESHATSDLYIGIDPGSTGAIAVVHGDRVTVFDIPLSEKPIGGTVVDDDALIALAAMLAGLGPRVVVLEHTWGIRGQGGASQYKFGDTAAAIRIALKSAGIPVAVASAMKWTTALRCGSDKMRHVEMAKQLFRHDIALFTPRRGVVTLEQCKGRADATLIAEYGRRFRCHADQPLLARL